MSPAGREVGKGSSEGRDQLVDVLLMAGGEGKVSQHQLVPGFQLAWGLQALGSIPVGVDFSTEGFQYLQNISVLLCGL